MIIDVRFSRLIGNLLDKYDQLPNDIKSDPGFEALKLCIENIYSEWFDPDLENIDYRVESDKGALK